MVTRVVRSPRSKEKIKRPATSKRNAKSTKPERPPQEKRVGVVLAGGNGTRLRPLTYVMNKHLLPVYNRPMIDLPIQTLRDYGCDEIILVTGGEHIGAFAEYLGDSVTYRVQTEANGVAGALACVEGLVSGVFPVILGDNYLSTAPEYCDGPTIFTSNVMDPERFGVFEAGIVVEKPKNPVSHRAVIGFYVYDEEVFEFIGSLEPSNRNELEITDVNNRYLLRGGMNVLPFDGYWRDMGTFNTLLQVANRLKSN